MKIIIVAVSLFLLVSACKRHLTYEQKADELKSAMQLYLNNPKHTDTSKVKFTVLDVIYFEDKTVYDCRFKVKMKQPSNDTVGDMAAWISKDFSTIKRKY